MEIDTNRKSTRRVTIHRDHVKDRKCINQYEVVKTISEGVHGKVKLAYDTKSGQKVALKVLRRACRTTRGIDTIHREIAVLKRVRHDNVISCLELIDDQSYAKVYLALEYAEIGRLPWRKEADEQICRHEWGRIQELKKNMVMGLNMDPQSTSAKLEDSITGRPSQLPPCLSDIHTLSTSHFDSQCILKEPKTHWPEPFTEHFQYVPCITQEQARRIIADVVSGLEYLHECGIIHRDIKPENLLWTRDYRVKIADFSTAYVDVTDDSDQSTCYTSSHGKRQYTFNKSQEMLKTVGTPGFIAPELCCMKVDIKNAQTLQQVDVWSLGATLYCLIFARLPFVALNEYQLYQKMAIQNALISTQRLMPVVPSVDDESTFKVNHYRKDEIVEYEHVGDSLIDLLQKMLVRNPHQRIRLAGIKSHPWLD